VGSVVTKGAQGESCGWGGGGGGFGGGGGGGVGGDGGFRVGVLNRQVEVIN